MKAVVIRQLKDEAELQTSLRVIRESFITVADELNLTKETAPANAAFIEYGDMQKLVDRNAVLFGMYNGAEQIGFFAVEAKADNLYYLNKLAVLPAYRHQGCGGRALEFVFEYVESRGGGTISIGIINEHTLLKNWYGRYGFTVSTVKTYPHLPFTVCMMERRV